MIRMIDPMQSSKQINAGATKNQMAGVSFDGWIQQTLSDP